jgi:hypothetical protein
VSLNCSIESRLVLFYSQDVITTGATGLPRHKY